MRVLRYWRLGGVGAAVASAAVVAAVALGGAALAADPAVPTYPECTKKPTPQDLEGAKGAHKAAAQFYDRGDYEKAIRYWNDALGFDCSATDLLRNIANALEKKGDLPGTVATLKVYLKRTGPDATLEERVKNLEARISAADAGAAPVPTGPTPQPTVTVSVAPTSTAPPPTPEGARPYGNKPWIAVGVGGGVALIGVIPLILGYGNISSAASVCPNHVCPMTSAGNTAQSQGNTGQTEAAAGWGLFTVGVLAAAGGLTWQFVFNKPRDAAAPPAPAKAGMWVAPVGPGQVGLSAGGSF